MTSSSTPPDGPMRAELLEARQRFIASWPKRHRELQDLAQATDEASARDDLKRASQRLVGSAGLVGFKTLSVAAQRLERVAADGATSSADLADALASLGEAYAQDESAPPEWAAQDDPTRPPPLTIVLAEDDDVQQMALTRYLQSAGHTVTSVERGEEVLATVRRVRPSLLVLDVQLPDIDGYTLCRQVKADPALASVGVVFLTAAISTDDRLAGLLLGADDYIEKPVDLADVLLRLTTVAERRAREVSQPAKLAPGELSYPDFVARVTERLESAPGTLVLLRMPSDVGLRVARWLMGELRRDDLLGRYRDDLRVLFLPGIVGRVAERQVDDIVSKLAASGLPVASGFASATQPGARSLPTLLQDADARLSAASVEAIPSEPGGAGAAGAAAPTITVRRRSVVVADDDEVTRLIATRPLARAGIHYRTAGDGRQALELLDVEMSEVLVLDLEMPELDGLGVLEALAKRAGPRPRVIVVSANRQEDDVRRALALGADDYVIKPFNPLMLLARIRQLMH